MIVSSLIELLNKTMTQMFSYNRNLHWFISGNPVEISRYVCKELSKRHWIGRNQPYLIMASSKSRSKYWNELFIFICSLHCEKIFIREAELTRIYSLNLNILFVHIANSLKWICQTASALILSRLFSEWID